MPVQFLKAKVFRERSDGSLEAESFKLDRLQMKIVDEVWEDADTMPEL